MRRTVSEDKRERETERDRERDRGHLSIFTTPMAWFTIVLSTIDTVLPWHTSTTHEREYGKQSEEKETFSQHIVWHFLHQLIM
jgi:hypothetical protein